MRRQLAASVLALGWCLAWCRLAHAQAQPLSEQRSTRYYAWHAGLTAAGLAAVGVEELVSRQHGPGYDLVSFGPDDAVRANFSASSAQLSDKLLLATMTAPLLLQMSNGFDTSMGNASLIYAEAHAIDLLLANSVKLIVRRPRPYTHSTDPSALAFAHDESADAYASFYSAHASTAFTSAAAGSFLYAARTNDLAARHVVWGVEFLLAGTTAQLRVRAGRHYRTDIWVGTLAGLAVGTAVPALHHVDLGRVRGSELATAGGAFAVSMLLSEAVDFCSLLGAVYLCNLPRDVTVPLSPPAPPAASWVVLPSAVAGGAGLSMVGQW